jgi:GDPmannose 4,6-dehydratase
MKALIIGALGMDGKLLSAQLRQRGIDLIGIDRVASPKDGVEQFDLLNADGFADYLHAVSPDMVFHFAAVHGPSGTPFEQIWRQMLSVNVASAHIVLEYLRTERPDARFVYASSIMAFGNPLPAYIDDKTPTLPSELYGISKQTATAAVDYYRRKYHVNAAALHFSNHESWLRAPSFFIPKMLAILAGAVRDEKHIGSLHTLDFHRDWGCAEEYMGIALDVAQRNSIDSDYVVASGRSVYARDLVDTLFARFGLDYRKHIVEEVGGESIRGKAPKIVCDNLKDKLGFLPKVTIEDVCMDILNRNYSLVPSL